MNNTIRMLNMLFGNEPFFRGTTFGIQGYPPRHVFMMATIKEAAATERPLRLLEIGSWLGSSAFSFCKAINMFSENGGEILCVDPWILPIPENEAPFEDNSTNLERAMHRLATDDVAYSLYLHNARIAASRYSNVTIEHKRGFSKDVLLSLPRNYFDIIYIDGNHYYQDAMFDIRTSDLLLNEDGIMCGDDLECQSTEIDIEHARNYSEKDSTKCPKTGRSYHPGVTLAVGEFFKRRISSYMGYWAVRKTPEGYIDLVLNDVWGCIPDHFNQNEKAQCEKTISHFVTTQGLSKAG